MTTSTADNPKLIALREEFDNSFARAPLGQTAQAENLLAIQLGGVAHAIRVAQIGGLYVDRHIMPLPTPAVELLGVAAFRGQLAPVYDLAAMLGYARHSASRWLVLLRLQDSVAFTFDAFDAHIAASPEDILRGDGKSPQQSARSHIGDAVRTANGILPIIDLHSIVENIKRQYATPTKTKGKSP
jgi:purine-binding chemotaxis protein CheW